MSRYLVWCLLLFSVIGTVLVLFFNNFFVIWLCLELSTFSIIPILFLSKSSRGVEAAFKYFLINVVAALMFLTWGLHLKFCEVYWGFSSSFLTNSYSLVIFPLSVKLGLAPFHFWFPEVLNGVGFLQGLWISTWQKIAPIYLCCVFCCSSNLNLFFILGTLSVIIGSWGGLNQTQTRKILGFSSVSYMGWIFCGLPQSLGTLIFLFSSYFLISGALFLVFNCCRFYSLFNLLKFISFPLFVGAIICGLLSLGGIPPFGGFLIKFIPIGLLSLGGNFVFVLPLIFGALISLFFYLRVLFNVGFLIPPMSIGGLSLYSFTLLSGVSAYFCGWFLSLSVFLFLYLDLALLIVF
nr:NADH dehydrogenase subuinit 2 [Euapta godeffroyi]